MLISGGMTSRPRTMPITSPSPTPGSTQRSLAGAPGVRAPYTANHPYSGVPISTTAPYASNMGVGSSGVNTSYSGIPPSSSYGGVSTQGGYAGGRGMQQRPMQYSSGQGQSGTQYMYDEVRYNHSPETRLQKHLHTCTCMCLILSLYRGEC